MPACILKIGRFVRMIPACGVRRLSCVPQEERERVQMSKYDPLWKYLKEDGRSPLRLSFEEIKQVLGFEIDHSFLNYKKEAKEYGYQVEKISLKEKNVLFQKTEGPENRT